MHCNCLHGKLSQRVFVKVVKVVKARFIENINKLVAS